MQTCAIFCQSNLIFSYTFTPPHPTSSEPKPLPSWPLNKTIFENITISSEIQTHPRVNASQHNSFHTQHPATSLTNKGLFAKRETDNRRVHSTQKGRIESKRVKSRSGICAPSHRLCVNCHLKIYNEESIENGKKNSSLPYFPTALSGHITKHSIERCFHFFSSPRLLPLFIEISFTFSTPSCHTSSWVLVITSLSLNRKTIDAVNLSLRPSAPRAHHTQVFPINAREIKDKVNRLVAVG